MRGGKGVLECLLWLLVVIIGVAAGAAVLPLESFEVDGTRLVLKPGTVSGSLPPELGTFSNVTRIELVGRKLSGLIPPELGNLAELEYIDLSHNYLTGPIPAELGHLDSLVSLNLSYNFLVGPVPHQLGNLGSLAWLNLFANYQLSGSIPPELGNLTSLQYLNLATNSLTDALPTSLGKLTSLKELYVYENQLTGAIDDGLGNLPNLVTLSLSNNSLSGAVPPSLGNYKLATVLLANNSLSGFIPPALVKRLKSNLTYVCLYIKRGNPDLSLDPSSGQCPTSAPVATLAASPPALALAPPTPAVTPPDVTPPAVTGSPPRPLGPPPPSSTQVNPSQQQNMAKILGLALALPTGLLSFALTVAFFVMEVRKHRKAKQVIVTKAVRLCRTGARNTPTDGPPDETQPLSLPPGMGDAECDAALTTILKLVLLRLEAWPKCMGLRGDPNGPIWRAHNFSNFEHYVLFRALADADVRYSKVNSCLLDAWDAGRQQLADTTAIIDGMHMYLKDRLHDRWTGSVEELY